MDTVPPSSDPALLLSGSTYHHLIHTLLASLPDPPGNAPDARTHRDRAATAEACHRA